MAREIQKKLLEKGELIRLREEVLTFDEEREERNIELSDVNKKLHRREITLGLCRLNKYNLQRLFVNAKTKIVDQKSELKDLITRYEQTKLENKNLLQTIVDLKQAANVERQRELSNAVCRARSNNKMELQKNSLAGRVEDLTTGRQIRKRKNIELKSSNTSLRNSLRWMGIALGIMGCVTIVLGWIIIN